MQEPATQRSAPPWRDASGPPERNGRGGLIQPKALSFKYESVLVAEREVRNSDQRDLVRRGGDGEPDPPASALGHLVERHAEDAVAGVVGLRLREPAPQR